MLLLDEGEMVVPGDGVSDVVSASGPGWQGNLLTEEISWRLNDPSC